MTGAGWAAFLAAAAVGAPARYLVDGWVQDRTGGAIPWGTFVVNVSGCCALGVVVGLARHHGLDPATTTALGTGGLGAYTTFSTFTFETVRLAEQGDLDHAVANALAGVVVGFVAASVGLALMAAV